MAHLASQLLMLICQLEGLFEYFKDWFHDEENDVLYDEEVPFYSNAKMVRMLMQRISAKSNEMNQYRSAVSKSINRGEKFGVVIASLKDLLRADEPSLDMEIVIPGNHALHASNAYMATRVDDRLMTSQTGYQMGDEQEVKRQRIAQQSIADRSGLTCNYWDGTRCDYEKASGRKCKFSEGHNIGVSTFKGPYIAKQYDTTHANTEMKEFQQWKINRDHTSQLPSDYNSK